MSEAISVPVVVVSEPIVLPTMVVPIELDDAARTAVDAAQASESGKLLIAPRLDDRYPTYRVLASIVPVGRVLGSGDPRRASCRYRYRHDRPRCGAVGRGDRGRRPAADRRDPRAGRRVQEA